MAQQVESGPKSFEASEAITQYAVVKLTASSGTAVSECSTGEAAEALGIAQATTASGGYCPVSLFESGRTYKAMAAGSITVGAKVYLGATGYVSATVAGKCIGVALQAADGAASIFEFRYAPEMLECLNVITTTDVSLAAHDSGAVVVLQSGANIEFPDQAKGLFYDFITTSVTTTPILTSSAGAVADAFIRNGTAFGTTADSIKPITVGAECRVVCDGTYWYLQARNGSTWSS